ncbi:MAG: hypothetical protein AAFV53_10765, partial [Myxococcota bacterium]
MADFGELLVQYSARVGRLHRGEQTVELAGPGGGLAAAVDRLGIIPLAAGLAEGDRLELEDQDVTLSLHRQTPHVLLRVKWADGPELTEALDVAPGSSLLTVPDEPDTTGPRFLPDPSTRITDLKAALHDPQQTLYFTSSGVWGDGKVGAGEPLLATIPAIDPGELGGASFRSAHNVRAAYIAGAMAGGIGSPEMVIAMSRAGLLGFFGAGGLPMASVRSGVEKIMATVGEAPAGFNLLHNPNEPAVEEETVDLYLRHGCRYVSASAYMTLTPALVRYRLTGIRKAADGQIKCPNRVFAKISRPDVAERFMRPAPEKILEALVANGGLTSEEA